MKPVVFLDRDGTINVDAGYVHLPEQWQFEEGAVEGLRRLQTAGFLLVVVTNQSGIAHGLYKKEDMERLHTYMQEMLSKEGVAMAAIMYCPHGRVSSCDCRKPKTGLARRAEKEIGPIDYPRSWTVGDKPADIEFGQAVGTKTALIRSRYWKPETLTNKPDIVVDSLLLASRSIIGENHYGTSVAS